MPIERFSDAATFTISANKIPCPGGAPFTNIFGDCDEAVHFGIRESESECSIADLGPDRGIREGTFRFYMISFTPSRWFM